MEKKGRSWIAQEPGVQMGEVSAGLYGMVGMKAGGDVCRTGVGKHKGSSV